MSTASASQKSILHISKREVLRPIRDQILRLSGYVVNSTFDSAEGLNIFRHEACDLVLIDVESVDAIHAAEHLCSAIRTIDSTQLVAFVCNWRVAVLTDCPDEILRADFDPAAFVEGVHKVFSSSLHRQPLTAR